MIKNDPTPIELAELVKNNKSVVIDFHATWCGPCKMFAPIFERIAEKNEADVQFVRIDVDKVPELAQKYSVISIPTIVGIRNGEVLHFSSGLMNEPSFQAVIDKLMQ